MPMRAESSGAPVGGVPGVEVGKRALDGERGPHSALGVVLLRLRIAEQRHQPVAELFQHMAAKIGHRSRSFVEIGVDEVAPILGVELRGEARRADKVAENDCDRATLGRCLKALGWSRLRRGSGKVRRRPAPAITAIASSSRLRSPTTETPMSLRSSTVSRGSRSASILLSRNFSSYWPSPRPRSHPPTSIAAPHMAGRMIAHARRRVHQPRSRRARTCHVPARKFRISPEIGTCADAADELAVSREQWRRRRIDRRPVRAGLTKAEPYHE